MLVTVTCVHAESGFAALTRTRPTQLRNPSTAALCLAMLVHFLENRQGSRAVLSS